MDPGAHLGLVAAAARFGEIDGEAGVLIPHQVGRDGHGAAGMASGLLGSTT